MPHSDPPARMAENAGASAEQPISHPRLLVSVRSAEEAQTALAGGADIIDVKEPSAGSLGRAALKTIFSISSALSLAQRGSGQPSIPFSVAMGELREQDELTPWPELPAAVRWVKVGLSGCRDDAGWSESWIASCQRIAPHAGRIAVAYADAAVAQSPTVWDVLHVAIATNSAGFLIDTFAKDGRTLFDWISVDALAEVIAVARREGLLTAVAGSLRRADLPAVLMCRPDIVAVRSAVCGNGNRTAAIDAERVADFRAAMQA